MGKKLELELVKPGQKGNALSLSLKKQTGVVVELRWESSEDLDGHMLLATNDGDGGRVYALSRVLSTYNTELPLADGSSKHRICGDTRSFKTPCGSLVHRGDARSGGSKSDADEIITVHFSLIPDDVNEIPIFITIDSKRPIAFSQVKNASIRILDDSGDILGEYHLTRQFGEFNAVQMGSLVRTEDNGWEYVPAGSGFSGDFNTILEHFSG